MVARQRADKGYGGFGKPVFLVVRVYLLVPLMMRLKGTVGIGLNFFAIVDSASMSAPSVPQRAAQQPANPVVLLAIQG